MRTDLFDFELPERLIALHPAEPRDSARMLVVDADGGLADRAVRVCDRLRPILPLLLAVSANSPYVDGHFANLHTTRTQTFTKSFPRCGIPDAYGSWAAFRTTPSPPGSRPPTSSRIVTA